MLVIILLSLTPTLAIADSNYAVDPVGIIAKSDPRTAARGVVFAESIDAGVTIGWIRYSHIPVFNSDGSIDPDKYWDWKVCNSWQDKSCPQKDGFTTEGKVVLGKCSAQLEIGCVEDFTLTDNAGSNINLVYVGPAYRNVDDIPEVSSIGIPRSSSPLIYRDSTDQLYIVRAGLWVSMTGQKNIAYRFSVDVTQVVAESDNSLTAPVVRRRVDESSGKGIVNVEPSPSRCVSVDTGICYRPLVLDQNKRFGVKVRVPRAVSGWLHGRVADATFHVEKVTSKSQVIVVDGGPAQVPIAGGWVNYKDLPKNFIENLWPSGGYDTNPNSSYLLVPDPTQGDEGMKQYLAWAPYLKDKAIVTQTLWNVGTNMSGNDAGCLQSTGRITGFVASNASIYSTNPPDWNSGTSTLSYKVASPHFDENSKVTTGTYTLAMPLSTIECLYHQSSLPPSATVSIVYGSEVADVTTVALKSTSGWVFFAASGFHYSNPTIKVKFISPKKKSITCAKGATKKVVAGPSCPAGYKKVG